MSNKLLKNTSRKTFSKSGKCGLGLTLLALVFTIVAFATSNWIQSDPRIYGSKLDRMGLWAHCYRSLPDYNDPKYQKFFAGCRWIFDPFTEGYSELKNYLRPRKSSETCTLQWGDKGWYFYTSSVVLEINVLPSWTSIGSLSYQSLRS